MARGAKAFLRLSKAKKVLEVLSDYYGSDVDFLEMIVQITADHGPALFGDHT
jgi:hypothetical protein